jgi:hypothetical protein
VTKALVKEYSTSCLLNISERYIEQIIYNGNRSKFDKFIVVITGNPSGEKNKIKEKNFCTNQFIE